MLTRICSRAKEASNVSCHAHCCCCYLCLTFDVFSREACKQAGMAVTRIVTEPTAAIIAYGLHNHHVHEHHITRDAPRANYLVVNIGGTEVN
jgi:hypothetical protein